MQECFIRTRLFSRILCRTASCVLLHSNVYLEHKCPLLLVIATKSCKICVELQILFAQGALLCPCIERRKAGQNRERWRYTLSHMPPTMQKTTTISVVLTGHHNNQVPSIVATKYTQGTLCASHNSPAELMKNKNALHLLTSVHVYIPMNRFETIGFAFMKKMEHCKGEGCVTIVVKTMPQSRTQNSEQKNTLWEMVSITLRGIHVLTMFTSCFFTPVHWRLNATEVRNEYPKHNVALIFTP